MCATCGCGDDGAVVTLAGDDEAHDHSRPHRHPHGAGDAHVHTETVTLEQRVLAKNDLTAEQNRGWLAERNILALNILSSPAQARPHCSSEAWAGSPRTNPSR